jgi:hypothetical protein
MSIGEWFSNFCSTLIIGSVKRESFSYRSGRITKALNIEFRKTESETANRFYVGSMGRETAIPSVSDVDLLYVLPYSIYQKFNSYTGNKQSALLGAVREAIQKTYSSSSISGDGQVVVINFNDNVRYEVLPAFVNKDGSYTFPDANSGGSWKICYPKSEMNAFAQRNSNCSGNLVQLARIVRAWRDYNNVSISGMLIDTLAYQFNESWMYRNKSYSYYDYLTRDFFSFLASQNANKTYWLAPGSGAYVYRNGSFEYKARQAELRAIMAINNFNNGYKWSARQKFREIYGTTF